MDIIQLLLCENLPAFENFEPLKGQDLSNIIFHYLFKFEHRHAERIDTYEHYSIFFHDGTWNKFSHFINICNK